MRTLVLRAAALVGFGLAAVAVFAAADDWRFWRRYANQYFDSFGPSLERYDSRVPLRGGNAPKLTVAAPGDRTVAPQALDSMSAYARAHHTSALLVWQGGRLQRADYWEPAGRTDSKSLAKMLAGLAVGCAVAEGRIRSIDDSVAEYLPEWKNDPRAAITIRHLLWMESGLAWYRTRDRSPWAIAQRGVNTGELEHVLLGLKQVAPPGTVYDYSNVTTDLLGLIVARATGSNYADYVSQALWQPIGAADAEMYADHPGGLAHAGCCILASAEDWLRVGVFAAHGGRVGDRQRLPTDWIAQATRPSPQKPGFGLHVWLGQPYQRYRTFYPEALPPDAPAMGYSPTPLYQSEPFAADDLFMFDGADNQKIYIAPSADLVIVRMGQAPGVDWDDAFLPNTALRNIVARQDVAHAAP